MPASIAESLEFVLDSTGQGLIGNLLTLAGRAGRTWTSARALHRPDTTVPRAARELESMRGTEFASLGEDEWTAAAEAVADSFRAAPLDLGRIGVLVAVDAEALAAHVRTAATDVLRAARLSPDGRTAYDRLLARSCAYIVEQARHVPALESLFRRDTLRQLQAVADDQRKVLELAQRLLAVTDRAAEFEGIYREQLRRTLGGFELFGVARGRLPKRQSFERSYVPLAVARGGTDRDSAEELSGAGFGLKRLADSDRVLLRGGAGAGKTTFLRWLIDASSGPDDPVPFFVPLRQFADRDFPLPKDMVSSVAGVLAEEMPEGWATGMFRGGRALLLVDGIDELVQERRDAARGWLGELLSVYPELRCYVTTRPSAIPEDWLAELGFESYDLLPLSMDGVHRYLRSWHQAARAEQDGDAEGERWLEVCERRLTEAVESREDLRRLAASPLLCGLLCVLHRDRDMQLPQDRRRLYDAALDLLLRRWDDQRGVRREADRWLDAEEQAVLLQRLAHSFVRNREIVVSRDEAVQRLRHAVHGMRPAADPPMLLQHLLERTGVLREPAPGQVQFVHRTFRDYLAAHELVNAGDIGLLLDHAHRDEWLDVVVMAVTLARPRERAKIMQGLLAGNEEARRDGAVADRLRLLAVACLDHASVVEPDSVRDEVHAAAAKLIPPTSPQAAEMLARAGAFVLDLLPGPAGLSEQDAAHVIRTAALVGGPAAARKIGEFTAVRESPVLDELLRAWRYAPDPEDYARNVLRDVDFGERRVDMGNWKRIRHVRHLRNLRVIRCMGSVNALEELAAAPSLHTLELMQNEVLHDLTPLQHCTTLRTLALTQCTRLRDLSPLRDTGIERLSLHFVAADLTTLQGAPVRTLTIRQAELADGLHPLPADLPLRELVLDNRADRRDLDGVRRWQGLRSVTLHGAPSDAEVVLLGGLPELAELWVRGAVEPGRINELRMALPGVVVAAQ